MKEMLEDNGWKCIDAFTFEKKNRSGYVFRVFFNEDDEEWWCNIDDKNHDCCRGIVHIPSYNALESLFRFYGQ